MTTVDDICECITVKIDMDKMKNVIVSCVFRAPNSSIESFKDVFEAIHFLNPNKSSAIEEFINAIYSKGLHPSITKPSRIT